jgi:hypothetical protein
VLYLDKKVETKGALLVQEPGALLYLNSNIFGIFLLWSEMQELTPFPNQDKIWHEGNLLG